MTERIDTDHVAHLLPAYVAGTLEPTEQLSVLAHLVNCPTCRAERAAWEAIQGALQKIPAAGDADDIVLQQVWNRVDADTARGTSPNQLHAVFPGRAPDAARARVWHQLQNAPEREAAAAAHSPHQSEATPQVRQTATPVRRWALTSFATAALVAFTLAVAFLAGGLQRAGTPNDQEANIPAVLVTLGTPAANQTAEKTLVEVMVPPDWVPDTVYGGQNHYTMAPGINGMWDPAQVSATCCMGPRLNYVLEGTYTMRSEGVVRVLRQGSGAWEEVVPGTEVILKPGDAVLSQMTDRFEAANTATESAELLDGVLFTGEASSDPVPLEQSGRPAWSYHGQDITLSPQPVPSGPAILRLRKVPLAKGSELPRPAGAVVQLGVSLDPEAVVLTGSPSSAEPYALSNVGTTPVTVYVLTLETAPAGETVPTGTPAP